MCDDVHKHMKQDMKFVYCNYFVADLTCSGLVTPKDGHLLGVSHNTTATVGTVAQFVCPVGTILKGNSVIMCQNDGRWSGPAPECHPLG